MTQADHTTTSRVDLHCHSTASAIAKLGVQGALGLPECATPPEEVHALAKRRGMDFVTITDHDTISGALAIADRPDVFVSEELTVGFHSEPQQVQVLCLGITPDDHEWLQAHRDDVEVVAAYLHEHEIACALAHPFYAVAAPLTPRHRRRLAELFGIWEVRNGARDAELNQPAAIYGLLRPPRPEALAGAVAGLASSRAMRERLARGGLAAARERTWDAALGRLAAGWRRALTGDAATPGRRAA